MHLQLSSACIRKKEKSQVSKFPYQNKTKPEKEIQKDDKEGKARNHKSREKQHLKEEAFSEGAEEKNKTKLLRFHPVV